MPIDILLGDDFDLLIESGDFVTGESTRQHQSLILLTGKGENREFPLRGVGLHIWQNDDVQYGSLLSEIKKEFEADGMNVSQVKASGFNVQVEAEYE